MSESGWEGARAGFRAGAPGVGLGAVVALVVRGLSAVFGDGAFPSGAVIVVAMSAVGFLGPFWQARPGNRRPATVIAVLVFVLVAMLVAQLAGGVEQGSGHGPSGGLALGYLAAVLVTATAFGALTDPPGAAAGDGTGTAAGRGRRHRPVVHGAVAGLLALLAVLVAVTR
ncbi:hypothetical protein K353_03402 [Kitasatospora sp. SolWspMP-SS2h]|uniref:hypothetical protein n=1 Tax=Kitasatospora sp. SolWspMP-SS2h TaxID=1305729 RepID=UPI000DBFA2DE|nr:hypothetical protein [Kitasatospora sp. SolWspMP-SS2h]RAJ40510.1 hypothetical protein K353_03402 [Kitasatospora sp. SolWspMP-SS2h]